MFEDNSIKQLYIVYEKDSFGLCAVDLYIANSCEQAIENFKKEHFDNTDDFILEAKIVDKCNGYKILVEV